MQVTETLSDGLRRGFTVVLPAADIESKRSTRLAQLTRELTLPGFRPGRVPLNLVRKRYGGAVTAEVLEQSVNEATQQVLNERGLRSAGEPRIELGTIEEARDLEFRLEVELLPDITLPDFGAIHLTRLRAEPSEETVDRAVAALAQRQRKLEPVEEARPAAAGDVLVADYAGTMDGAPFAGGTGTDAEVEIGGGGFIPGFAEQLEGIAPGETRHIDVTFPEGYGVAELAGKPARFEVTAKALKRVVLPAIDDAFAATLGFDDLAEIRRLLSQQAQREYDQLSRLRLKRQLLDALAERVDFPVPQGLAETEFAQIWQRLEADRKAGRVDEEDAGKAEEDLRAEYRAIAERRVRLGLLLAEVGRSNAITVGQDELLRAMRAEAGRYPGHEQEVMELFRKNPAAVDSLRGPIFEDKVVDYILELAHVTDETVTPEVLARDPEPDQPATPAPPVTDPGQTAGADS